ncbi:4'-phosphopantetheinyl transferase superfamily protein [Streptomyces griseus]|uniref:4'-phosphopantetheinyl transferase family protein n=1 Tax=Streptomyces griseus TaxID=1911 RepID=UPI0037A903C1|nr:4'-phosphopantetheinyl transferase superfamily protein [Streptomyces fimicarius]WTC88043.1 4'-phosphopantetheinyl transferase superfamily protein [Streptomyces griseus]WTD69333.1 4'-phosphopantetheinyl transferase superfamily protein [Streptomyces griseus]
MNGSILLPATATEIRQPGPDEPSAFTVAAGRIDLWLIHPPEGDAAGALARTELDERERARADAFVRPSDGLLYAAAHVALRRLIAAYTAGRPQDVRFMREACPGCGESHGRPAVAPPPPPLHFSLSHSAGVALVGVADRPIGVDVERLPGAETVDICSRSLHPEEQAELNEVPAGEARRKLFGRIWTRKEAYLKGLGTGLSRSPAEDYLGADRDRHPGDWTMVGIPCVATHAASAAVRGTPPAVAEVRTLPGAWLTDGRSPAAPA